MVRIVYAAIVAGFIFWQVMIYGGFTFTFTGHEGWAMRVFVFLAFWLDIPLALASIVWPRFGLIAIPANIGLTVAYVVGVSLVETFHHIPVGWPGAIPVLLLFMPKLLLIALLVLVVLFDRHTGTSSNQTAVAQPTT